MNAKLFPESTFERGGANAKLFPENFLSAAVLPNRETVPRELFVERGGVDERKEFPEK
ncbi:MAG: hypothetical protein ACI4JT_05140 [Oscillospiraceae bacterium]